MQDSDKIAYTPKSLSQATDTGMTKIWEAIKNGDLRSRKLGRKRLILREDAMKWLRGLPAGS